MKTFLLIVFFAVSSFLNAVNAQQDISRTGVTIPTLEINLYARAMNGSMFLADGVLQNFNKDFSAAVDNMDVRKFMNATDNLAIKNGNYNLIVERRPNICITDTLLLMLTGTRVAPYRFDIDPSVLNYPNIKSYLIDKYLSTETPVSMDSVTSINFDITTDALSSVANRFMIVYRQQAPVRFAALTATRNTDNSINTVFKTENENNVNNYSIERSIDGIVFEPIARQMPTANNFGNPYYNYLDEGANTAYNWYRIKANVIAGTAIYSMSVRAEEAFKKQVSNINVFPNPVTAGTINIGFENKPAGLYRLSIVSSTGQIIYNEKVSVQSSFFNKTISVSALHSGIYRVITVDPNGLRKVTNLVVK